MIFVRTNTKLSFFSVIFSIFKYFLTDSRFVTKPYPIFVVSLLSNLVNTSRDYVNEFLQIMSSAFSFVDG